MASSSSSDRTKLSGNSIPTFNGTNYREWSDAVRAFMRYSGVWFLIEGYGSTTTSKVAGMARPVSPATEVVIAAWDEKNDKALGIIQLYVAQNLKHHVNDKSTALEAWDALKDEYEKPGAVGAFVAFQKLFNAQLNDSSALGPQLDAIMEASNQVNAAGIEVKEQLVALLMVNCLPKSYQSIASTILATHADVSKLKPSDVRPKIVEEESRRIANRTQISRVSKAPLLDKKCEKCGRNNHTTEQHWEKKPQGNSGTSGSNNQDQGQSQGKKKKNKGKGKGNGNNG